MLGWLKPVGDGFLSKAVEEIADMIVGTGGSIIGFKRKLNLLERNSEILKCKASDIVTEVENEELVGNKRRKTEVEKWLETNVEIQGDVRALEDEIRVKGIIMSCFMSVERVEKLNGRVEKLIEQSQHFGKLVLDVLTTRGEPLLTNEVFGEAFQRNLKDICDCLAKSNGQPVGIHGKAGVGKTELAKHIHNQFLGEAQYRVYWVGVFENISIKKLQDLISHAIGLTLSAENDEDTRAAKLNRELQNKKKFVLLLDNLGEDISLEKVGYPLGVDGCQLIITTGSERGCLRIGCKSSFEVKTLDEEEAWKLFRGTFGQEAVFAPQVEEIAKSVVKRYGGLPGGIIEMAKRMRGATEIPEWRNELEEVDEFLEGS